MPQVPGPESVCRWETVAIRSGVQMPTGTCCEFPCRSGRYYDRHLKTDGGSLPGGTVALKARLGRQVVNVCIHGVSVRPQGHDCRAHHMLDPPRAHERVACYTTNVTLLQPSQSVGGVGLMPGTMPFICPCEPRELQVRKDALHMSSRHQPNTADRLPFICPCEQREHAAATCAQRIGYSPCGGAAAIAPASCVSARS